MLDKTLPYYNIIMKRCKGTEIPDPKLPLGFKMKLYQEGDEKHWVDIMTSVGEFDSNIEAMQYFQTEYLPYMDELKRRSLFIETIDGVIAGTLTNWWNYTKNDREPSVHWVGVKPEYQGLGLGKALVFMGMKLMIELEGERDYFLHTQTWSYKAIAIYMKAGYKIVSDETFGDYENDYEKAIEIINSKITISY